MPMEWKECMMPQTVPNNPMNGAALAQVAKNGRLRVSDRISLEMPCLSTRRRVSLTSSRLRSRLTSAFSRQPEFLDRQGRDPGQGGVVLVAQPLEPLGQIAPPR